MSNDDATSKYLNRISEAEYTSSPTVGIFVSYCGGGSTILDVEETKPGSASTVALIKKIMKTGPRDSENYSFDHVSESYKTELAYSATRRLVSQAQRGQSYDDSLKNPIKAYVCIEQDGKKVLVDISEFPDSDMEETG